jgi:hypothetical protein
MNTEVIEWAPFKTRAGVDEGTVLRLSESLQKEFLAKQRGYEKRELLRAGDGEYIDVVWWASMEDAEAAAKHVSESPTCNAYFGAMDFDPNDPASHPSHFRIVRKY